MAYWPHLIMENIYAGNTNEGILGMEQSTERYNKEIKQYNEMTNKKYDCEKYQMEMMHMTRLLAFQHNLVNHNISYNLHMNESLKRTKLFKFDEIIQKLSPKTQLFHRNLLNCSIAADTMPQCLALLKKIIKVNNNNNQIGNINNNNNNNNQIGNININNNNNNNNNNNQIQEDRSISSDKGIEQQQPSINIRKSARTRRRPAQSLTANKRRKTNVNK